MKTTLKLITIAITLTLFTSIAWCKPSLDLLNVDSKLKQQVLTMLSGIEKFPSEQEWKKLPKDGIEVLKVIVLDEKQWPSRRTRAILALSYFKSDDIKNFLISILSIEDQIAPMLKRKAVRALAKTYGEKSVSSIAVLLKEKDYFIREAVVNSLVLIGSNQAFSILKAHATIEKEAKLKLTIENAVKKSGK